MKNVILYRCCNTCLYKDNSFYGCSKAGECYNGFSAYSPNAEMQMAMKYRCIESFEVDCYTTDGGMLTEGRVKISCGSIWKRNNETDIIGAEVHLDNVETLEWLEIPGKDLDEYFEPLNEYLT